MALAAVQPTLSLATELVVDIGSEEGAQDFSLEHKEEQGFGSLVDPVPRLNVPTTIVPSCDVQAKTPVSSGVAQIMEAVV